MSNAFIEYVESFVPLDDTVRDALAKVLHRYQVSRNTYLVKEGEVVNEFNFIEKGSARIFYEHEGKEYIGWFSFDKSPAISYHSFITQKPSLNNVQVLEDSVIIRIARSDLFDLYNRFKAMERFGRLFSEWLYCNFVERTYSLQILSAKARYEFLIEHQPELFRRVPMGHIASYLGISQETLSRIRAKK
jgi:CRP-like cAMP-binding protein